MDYQQIRHGFQGIDLAKDADLLLHDAQYSTLEYDLQKGWGHSSMEDTLQFAATAGLNIFYWVIMIQVILIKIWKKCYLI